MADSELDKVTQRLQSTKVEETYELSFKGKGFKLNKADDGKFSLHLDIFFAHVYHP